MRKEGKCETVESAKGSGEWRGGRNSGEWKEGRRGLDSRGLMDFLIRDVGGDSVGQAVDFSGEVVVFAQFICDRRSSKPGHLCSHSFR